VDVPAGDFMMGCNSTVDTECNSDEKPYHKVTLSDFAIDKNLVTAVEYKQCVASGACSAPAAGDTCTYGVAGKEVFPVNCVTWNQAGAYCQWRGKHLPTEAQWEKAARGTDGRKYPWGNSSLDCSHAVMRANGCSSPNLTRIGSKPAGASPYGALDMAGNVWEWVADWYGAGYYSTSPAANPQGPSTGTQKSTRGGSYDTTLTSLMRTSSRSNSNPASAFDNVGFRCAK
jgi:formylglycine-generating enzyme required for sulfatase activity